MKNTAYTFRYDAIPKNMIGETVLEIGCSDNILDSKLRTKILQAKPYSCVDIEDKKPQFDIIKADILTYKFEKKYDTIIMIEVLEHIHLREWIPLVWKLKEAVKPGGNLIISVPANQKLEDYLTYWNSDYWEIHTVFSITKNALKYLFPGFKIKHVRCFLFNPDQNSFLWALGRFLNRVLILGYLRKKLPVLRESFLLFWKSDRT